MRRISIADVAAGVLKVPAVCKRLNRTRMTLDRWRKAGQGPPCVKIGGHWFYPLNHLEAYETAVAVARKGKRAKLTLLERYADQLERSQHASEGQK
jgi:predicted DNA-binding transcriptional regulator AlpA